MQGSFAYHSLISFWYENTIAKKPAVLEKLSLVDASIVYLSCQVVEHQTFRLLFFCIHAFSCICCLHCLLMQFTNTNHYFKQMYFYYLCPNYSNAEIWHCIIFMLLKCLMLVSTAEGLWDLISFMTSSESTTLKPTKFGSMFADAFCFKLYSNYLHNNYYEINTSRKYELKWFI